jgi:hypothetical protein
MTDLAHDQDEPATVAERLEVPEDTLMTPTVCRPVGDRPISWQMVHYEPATNLLTNRVSAEVHEAHAAGQLSDEHARKVAFANENGPLFVRLHPDEGVLEHHDSSTQVTTPDSRDGFTVPFSAVAHHVHGEVSTNVPCAVFAVQHDPVNNKYSNVFDPRFHVGDRPLAAFRSPHHPSWPDNVRIDGPPIAITSGGNKPTNIDATLRVQIPDNIVNIMHACGPAMRPDDVDTHIGQPTGRNGSYVLSPTNPMYTRVLGEEHNGRTKAFQLRPETGEIEVAPGRMRNIVESTKKDLSDMHQYDVAGNPGLAFYPLNGSKPPSALVNVNVSTHSPSTDYNVAGAGALYNHDAQDARENMTQALTTPSTTRQRVITTGIASSCAPELRGADYFTLGGKHLPPTPDHIAEHVGGHAGGGAVDDEDEDEEEDNGPCDDDA